MGYGTHSQHIALLSAIHYSDYYFLLFVPMTFHQNTIFLTLKRSVEINTIRRPQKMQNILEKSTIRTERTHFFSSLNWKPKSLRECKLYQKWNRPYLISTRALMTQIYRNNHRSTVPIFVFLRSGRLKCDSLPATHSHRSVVIVNEWRCGVGWNVSIEMIIIKCIFIMAFTI